MIRISKVTMTMRQLDRLKCIQGLIDGQLKQHAVATRCVGAYPVDVELVKRPSVLRMALACGRGLLTRNTLALSL